MHVYIYIHINCDLENTNWTIHINIFTVYILVPLRIQVMLSISLSVRTGGFQVGNPNPFRLGIRILIQKQGLCFFFPLRKCTSFRFSPWLSPFKGGGGDGVTGEVGSATVLLAVAHTNLFWGMIRLCVMAISGLENWLAWNAWNF